MIICTVLKDEFNYQIEIKGHSGYDTIGKDIVCSSVSTSFILTVNLLEKLGYKFSFESEEEIPMMKLKLNEYDKVCETILDNMIDCLKDVEKQYHKFLKIK